MQTNTGSPHMNCDPHTANLQRHGSIHSESTFFYFINVPLPAARRNISGIPVTVRKSTHGRCCVYVHACLHAMFVLVNLHGSVMFGCHAVTWMDFAAKGMFEIPPSHIADHTSPL